MLVHHNNIQGANVSEADIISRSILWTGRGQSVEKLSLRLQSGDIQERIISKHLPGAVIVAVNSRNEVVLLEKYRMVVDRTLIELPAGKIEPTDTAISGAQRELLEETGLISDKWTDLGVAYGAQGSSDWMCHYLLAEGTEDSGLAVDPHESHTHFWLPLTECWEWVFTGRICNNFSIVGLAKALSHLRYLVHTD